MLRRSRFSARQITVRRSVIHGWRREKVHRTYSMYNAAYSSLHTMRSSGRAVHLKPDNFCGSTLWHPDAIQYREIDRETASSMTHEATFPSLLQIGSLRCRRYNRGTSERAWPGRWTDLRRMAQGQVTDSSGLIQSNVYYGFSRCEDSRHIPLFQHYLDRAVWCSEEAHEETVS